MRILNAADVRRLLPMARAIPLMRDAFRAEAEGRADQPIRQVIPARGRNGLLGLMPGILEAPDWLGLKVLTIFPENFGTEIGSHQGFVLLFEPERGRPAALIDAGAVTAIRTAAASAAATDALAPKTASTLAIFGYGEQAASHLEAMALVRPLDQVRVWGRDFEKAQAFCTAHAGAARLAPVRTVAEAASADILCFVTGAEAPFFTGDLLRPGQHLIVAGSSVPSAAEVDTATVARARVYVDYEPSARELAGELRRAWAEGAIGDDHVIGSVGQVLTGAVPGRTSPDEITLFRSLGMIAEDIITADHILGAAEREGVGRVVDL